MQSCIKKIQGVGIKEWKPQNVQKDKNDSKSLSFFATPCVICNWWVKQGSFDNTTFYATMLQYKGGKQRLHSANLQAEHAGLKILGWKKWF
jgi:hypothetical protein